MSFAPTSPITGGPQTGLTSPTYTIALSNAPESNGKQYVVTALGGTQTGVTAHSVSSPFSLTNWIPKFWKQLGRLNSLGYLINNPVNTTKVVCRKGVTPLAGQSVEVATCTITMQIPAGAETNDTNNVRALLSAAFGLAWQQSAGIGDLVKDGVQ